MNDCKVIISIVIVFVALAPMHSILEGYNKGLCNKNVSIIRSRNISYEQIYPARINYLFFWYYYNETRTCYKIVNETVWVTKHICCKGYEYINKTCKPQCSSKCIHGYCAQPNICECDYGWDGYSCDEPLLCFVNVNFTEGFENENLYNEYNSPPCHLKCRDDPKSLAVNMKRSGNSIHYFIPIDSPCNALFTKQYGMWIGTVIGISLFIIVIYVLYVIRKKRKARNKIRNDIINESTKFVIAEYMEENPIYSCQ